jgi:hypothetical protein
VEFDPSPKFHSHEVIESWEVEVFVNETVRGANPDVTFAVKFAMTALHEGSGGGTVVGRVVGIVEGTVVITVVGTPVIFTGTKYSVRRRASAEPPL